MILCGSQCDVIRAVAGDHIQDAIDNLHRGHRVIGIVQHDHRGGIGNHGEEPAGFEALEPDARVVGIGSKNAKAQCGDHGTTLH